MILVPRQLRRTDFPGSVPYYGGRLTPQVIAGLRRPPAPPPDTPAAGADGPEPDLARQLEALADLRAQGVLTADEYDTLRGRLLGDA
jgi:hypothetical protein